VHIQFLPLCDEHLRNHGIDELQQAIRRVRSNHAVGYRLPECQDLRRVLK
jgi:hypothetical protein